MADCQLGNQSSEVSSKVLLKTFCTDTFGFLEATYLIHLY